MWDYNIPYQSPLGPSLSSTTTTTTSSTPQPGESNNLPTINLHELLIFNQSLGKDERYYDYLRFFEDEITKKGVPAVVNEYVFNEGDPRADDIFCRMFTDLLHPLIHLGCALEYGCQPALVAESLAAACVHGDWPKEVILPAEAYLRHSHSHSQTPSSSSSSQKTTTPSLPLIQTLNSLRQSPKISQAVKPTDPFNKIPDGLLTRATGRDFAPHLSRFQVPRSSSLPQIRRKMAEMMRTFTFMVGAAQHPGKREAMDFVLLHAVTAFSYLPSIVDGVGWIPSREKARLVEALGRVGAVMYAGCGCPELFPGRVKGYLPRYHQPGLGGGDGDGDNKDEEWEGLFRRAVVYRDEGHVAKVVRALYALERLERDLERDDDDGEDAEGEEEEKENGLPISREDILKIAHMAVDSAERAFETEGGGHHTMPEAVAEAMTQRVGQGGDMVAKNQMRWVFYGGLENAWRYVAELES